MRMPTMKIKKIEFFNFGPFYGPQELVVNVEPDKQLILIRALNDVVKTSFLKAFRFCFYGTIADPIGVGTGLELAKVPNRKAALEADGEASVLFSIDHNGDDYEVKRTAYFKKVKEHGDRPEITKWDYQIKKHGNMIIDPQNNLGQKNDFDDMIESWLPRQVSTFFFFDVEESRQYASKEPTPNILDSIKKILNIKQNTNAKKDLEKVWRQLNTSLNEAQTQDGATQSDAKLLEARRVKLDKDKTDLEVDYNQIKSLRENIGKLKDWLEEQSETALDWKEYNKLHNDQTNNGLAKQSIVERKKDFHDRRLLSEIIQLTVKPTNLAATNTYSPYEISVAKKNLDENLKKCSICDADITDSSIVHLKTVSDTVIVDEDAVKQDLLTQISATAPQSIVDTEHFKLLEEEKTIDDAIYSTDSAFHAIEDKLSSTANTASEEEHRKKQTQYDLQRGQVLNAQNAYTIKLRTNEEDFKELNSDVRQLSPKSSSDKVAIAQARVNLCQQAMDGFSEIIKNVVEKAV